MSYVYCDSHEAATRTIEQKIRNRIFWQRLCWGFGVASLFAIALAIFLGLGTSSSDSQVVFIILSLVVTLGGLFFCANWLIVMGGEENQVLAGVEHRETVEQVELLRSSSGSPRTRVHTKESGVREVMGVCAVRPSEEVSVWTYFDRHGSARDFTLRPVVASAAGPDGDAGA